MRTFIQNQLSVFESLSMITRINHIAIVVADLDDAIRSYQDRIGLTLSKRLHMPEQEVEIAFLPAGESMIELIMPTSEDSGVAKYLAKRGEGLHHISLKVSDYKEAKKDFENKDLTVMGEFGEIMAFIHPKSCKGILVEFTQV